MGSGTQHEHSGLPGEEGDSTITDGEALTVPSMVNMERAEMGLGSQMARTPSPVDL